MCGTSAVVVLAGKNERRWKGRPREVISKELEQSLKQIRHRGPDGSGKWISPGGSIALGQVRLAINDLSPSGAQPISNREGTIHAVVNGEIYEYDELRASMIKKQGYVFKGRSDSELVIALYMHYGAPSFFSHLRGEFSFCLYDSTRQLFIAARDRYGIKPLFWTVTDGRLLVASEMKAFLPIEGVKFEWDLKSIVDGAHTLALSTHFKGIQKVRPGHYMTCSAGGVISQTEYWDMEYPDKSIKDPRQPRDMIAGLREHLLEAVKIRLRADVKVGVSLSAGIDSSVVAGMVNHLTKKSGQKLGSEAANERLTCFSIGFEEDFFDESVIAERTAKHLGVKFHKVVMNEKRFTEDFEDATWHVELPYSNFNFVGCFALSRLVREKGFRVIVNGQGSDELFAGYEFFLADYLREADNSMERPKVSDQTRKQEVLEIESRPNGLGKTPCRDPPSVGRRQLNSISTVSLFTPPFLPRLPSKPWVAKSYTATDPHDQLLAGISGSTMTKIQNQWHPLHTGEYVFARSYLGNCLLAHLGDRGEMSHSIEGRTPFLDHKLAKYINGLPPSVKISRKAQTSQPTQQTSRPAPSNQPTLSAQSALPPNLVSSGPATRYTTKWILREAARPFVSDEIYQKEKKAYIAPMRFAFGGPLHQLFRKLVTEANIEQYVGFLDAKAIVPLVDQAFDLKGPMISVKLATITQTAMYVILGKRFRVPAAKPEGPI